MKCVGEVAVLAQADRSGASTLGPWPQHSATNTAPVTRCPMRLSPWAMLKMVVHDVGAQQPGPERGQTLRHGWR